MIESFSDILSLAFVGMFVVVGIYLLYSLSAKHYEQNMRFLEDKYYHFYDDSDDVDDGVDDPYDQTYMEE